MLINRIHIVGILLASLLLSARAEMPQPENTPNYLIHVWQTDNGLPENWVSSIRQTPDGYLWIGTRYGGLSRFDGVRFVNFNPENTRELQDVQVEHLNVDETGRLWIIMGNESVTIFDHGEFHLIRSPRVAPRMRAVHILTLSSNQALFTSEYSYLARLNLANGHDQGEVLNPPALMEPDPDTFTLGQEDVVWFTTTNQELARFTRNHFEFVTNAPGLDGATVTALATDKRHQLWIATAHRLMTWDGKQFAEHTPANGPPPVDVLAMSFSGDGGLWVLEKNRLRKYLDGHWVTEADPQNFQPDTTVEFGLHGDMQGNAWLVSYGQGLWHVKTNGVVHLLSETNGLPSDLITRWFQDAEGDIWVGTAGNGIARIRESLFHGLGPAAGLPGKVTRSVCVDAEGDLWAGTLAGGLARWHDGRFQAVPLPLPKGTPVENVTVFPANDGGLWVGTINQGLMRLDGKKTTRLTLPWSTIRVLFGDHEGRLWVGGLVNLLCLDQGQIKTYGSDDGFVDNHAIGAMAEDAAGAFWIVTGPGDLWKLYQGQFTRFSPPKEWASVRFCAVLPDTNGVVWIGTLGGGLLRFYDGKFTRCQKTNGLPDNNISQLLDSQDGYLWAGTYAGIFRARKTDLAAVGAGYADAVSCRVYGHFDGLPSLECSSGFQPACWRANDGQLYFSTANGVVSVNPREFVVNRVPPTAIIEEMLVDGQPRHLVRTPTNTVPVLDIEPGRHYVQFRFTGLSFAAPDGVRFRVKLEGVDSDWQNPGSQRLIGYGPLLPGHYRFQVFACNNDGIWNGTGDTLVFNVRPFYWETRWFKAGIALAVLTVLAIVVALGQRRRYRRKLEQVERQREMERERTRIAQDLHDDLGTSLTQISMLSALANRDQTPPAEAKELVQQVRSRAREMVTALDEIVWAVNPKNDSLLELINYLGYFAEEFFRPTSLRCQLDIPDFLPDGQSLSTETRHHLFLAFKEALNNVVRHSGASHVWVRVVADGHAITIFIKDDGHGLGTPDEAARRHGNGLNNMRQRLEQIGGRVEWQSAPGEGTVVTFRLPLGSR
ncbi:MAG TPA: two-component regulator propeller domain-containing protein [Verrucomicrobiae bacterium]